MTREREEKKERLTCLTPDLWLQARRMSRLTVTCCVAIIQSGRLVENHGESLGRHEFTKVRCKSQIALFGVVSVHVVFHRSDTAALKKF